MINGVYILIGVVAWAAYKLACWVDARAAASVLEGTDRPVGSSE